MRSIGPPSSGGPALQIFLFEAQVLWLGLQRPAILGTRACQVNGLRWPDRTGGPAVRGSAPCQIVARSVGRTGQIPEQRMPVIQATVEELNRQALVQAVGKLVPGRCEGMPVAKAR